MRYEISDYEWGVINPMLPNKPRGVRRLDDRRILWILRSGAPWRDLPESFGPYTTCYNRFVRWRRAGVWDQIMDALTAVHDVAVQMIDTSIVRVHQHGSCIAGNAEQHMGRSRGGLTSKIHAVVDTNGLRCTSGSRRVRLTTIGYVRFYSADCVHERCCWQIEIMTRTGSEHSSASKAGGQTSRRNEIARSRFASALISTAHVTWSNGSSIRSRQCRRIATRYDKLAANYLAFIKLASIQIWLSVYESAP
jgi:transposase